MVLCVEKQKRRSIQRVLLLNGSGNSAEYLSREKRQLRTPTYRFATANGTDPLLISLAVKSQRCSGLLPTQLQPSGVSVTLWKSQGNPEEKSGLRSLGDGLQQFMRHMTLFLQVAHSIVDNCYLTAAASLPQMSKRRCSFSIGLPSAAVRARSESR